MESSIKNSRDEILCPPNSVHAGLRCIDRSSKIDPMLVNSSDAALLLAISKRKLWELTNTGEITCVRVGRLVRYSPEDLYEWIECKKRGGE